MSVTYVAKQLIDMYPALGHLVALPQWFLYLQCIITSLCLCSIYHMLAALYTLSCNAFAWFGPYLVMVGSIFVFVFRTISWFLLSETNWILCDILISMLRSTLWIIAHVLHWIFRPAVVVNEVTIRIAECTFRLLDRQSGTMNSVSPLSQLVLAFRTGSLCSDGEACMNTVGTCRSGRCRQEVEKLEHLLHQAQRRASRSKKEYKRRLSTMKKKQFVARSRNTFSKARVAAPQSSQVTLISVSTQRQGQVSAPRSDNGHLLAAFAKMHSENKMLRTKVATLEAREAELVADQVTWGSRVDRLYSLNKALRTRVTTMKAETFAHRSRIANLSSANEELHAECDAFWEDVQDLRFELDSLRPAFAKMHSESKMLQTKVATLEAREAELVADQVTWGSRVDRLDSVNQALRTRVTTLQAETFAHHSRIANLYSENEQLCTERDAVWEDAQDLRCQLDSLRFAFLEMDSENRTLRTRVTKLESQEAGLVVDQIVLQSRLTKLNSAKDDLCVERDGSREDARPLGIRANGRGLKPQQWSTVQEGLKIDADSDDMMEHQDTSAQSHCLEDSRFLATDIRLEVPALQDALQETDTVQWEHEFLGEPQSSSCPALVRDTTPEAQHWRPSPDIATPEDQERSLAGYIYDVNTKISELGAEVVGTPLRCRGGRHLRKRAEVA